MASLLIFKTIVLLDSKETESFLRKAQINGFGRLGGKRHFKNSSGH